MNRKMLYSIVAVLLLMFIVVGGTYAYLWSSAVTSNNSIFGNAGNVNVIYTGGTSINESMSVVSSKEEGYNTSVSIRLAPNSASAKATLYIHIDEITENIAVSGFIWDVYGYRNGNLVIHNVGNFYGYDDTTNNEIPIVRDYLLSEDNTIFTVYFWVDGNQTGNSVVGGSFSGYIGATTEAFTSTLKSLM